MSNSYLILRDIYNEKVRINVDHILHYSAVGAYTEFTLNTGIVQVQVPIESIDQALIELHFMFKTIE